LQAATEPGSTVWHQRPLFDAIITDPPYGIRARVYGGSPAFSFSSSSLPTPTAGTREAAGTATSSRGKGCLEGLISLAANTLVVGGRLVFFLPEALQRVVPRHPELRLCSDSLDTGQRGALRRRLVVMEKT